MNFFVTGIFCNKKQSVIENVQEMIMLVILEKIRYPKNV